MDDEVKLTLSEKWDISGTRVKKTNKKKTTQEAVSLCQIMTKHVEVSTES